MFRWIKNLTSTTKDHVTVSDENPLPVSLRSNTRQVESITFTNACTLAGNLIFDVVSNLAGCTKTFTIPVTTTEDSVEKVAVLVRAALVADSTINLCYTVGGGTGIVTLTAKTPAANDTTLSMALTRAGATGVTASGIVATTAGVAGTKQVETILVTHVPSANGNLTWTVTKTGASWSPKVLTIPVLLADDSVEKVAVKIRAAMAADADIGAEFTLSGAAGNVIMTAKVPAADITGAGLSMALTAAGATAVTVGTSTDTTTGVLGVCQVDTVEITHAATTAAGSLTWTVTSSGMTGSPIALTIPLLTTDDTVEAVAFKIRAAMTADAVIGARFTMGGATGFVSMTAKVAAAYDFTANMQRTSAGGTGVTVGSIAHTTHGTLAVKQVETISVTHASVGAGTIVFRITAANMPGSPLDMSIPIAASRTAAQVATDIEAYLGAVPAVVSAFTVGGGVAGTVTLTAKGDMGNDDTLAMALVSAGTIAVTVGTSTDTTPGSAGTLQVATTTITAGASLGAGSIVVALGSAITACAKSLVVPIAATDTSATLVAIKVRAALNADADIAANYTIGGTAGAISITAKVCAANDTTPLGLTLSSAGATGVTAGTSANATPGVDPLLVSVSGIVSSASNEDMRGLSTAKPLATAVTAGTTYWSVDTDPHAASVEVSTGAAWVVVPSGSVTPLPVSLSANSLQPSATFAKTNSADAYTALDVVGPAVTANLTFANVSATAGAQVIILGAKLRAATNAVPATMGTFRLHIYNAAPTALADNAAFNLIDADVAKYQGYLTIGTPIDLGDNIWGQSDGVNLACKLAAASTTLYGVLQTVNAFTPANAATSKTITLEVVGA